MKLTNNSNSKEVTPFSTSFTYKNFLPGHGLASILVPPNSRGIQASAASQIRNMPNKKKIVQFFKCFEIFCCCIFILIFEEDDRALMKKVGFSIGGPIRSADYSRTYNT